MTFSAAKVIATCLILSAAMQMCCASSIPIWELLKPDEKVSRLYDIFAQLVSVHCKATASTSTVPVNQCKRNLLAYGFEKLQTFSNTQLEALDPYQRGGNELIWSSIMRDHASSTLITTRKPLPTPPASSLIILTHQKPLQAATPVAASTSSSTTSSQQYPKNPLFDNAAEHKHQYAMDMDIAYGYPNMPAHPQVEIFGSNSQQSVSTEQQPPNSFLSGPLVFRVRPDGTPVEEDQYKPLPRDDDLEAFHYAGRSSATNANVNGNVRQNKHRKIATISALKQQHLATLALQQQLQPPHEQPRIRRQFPVATRALTQSTFGGYFYGKGQA